MFTIKCLNSGKIDLVFDSQAAPVVFLAVLGGIQVQQNSPLLAELFSIFTVEMRIILV